MQLQLTSGLARPWAIATAGEAPRQQPCFHDWLEGKPNKGLHVPVYQAAPTTVPPRGTVASA
jgi:hypothetical protein